MPNYLSGAWQRCRAFVVKKYGPLPVVGLAAALFLLIAGIFFENWLIDRWDDFKAGWAVLMGMPIRFFGLVVFVIIASSVVLAFLDTSPTAKVVREWLDRKKAEKPTALSTEERLLIAPLRSGWEQYCRVIADYQVSFFRDYRNAVGNDDWPWFKLTLPVQQRAEESKKQTDLLMVESNGTPLKGIKGGLARWYQAYMELNDLMAQMRATEPRIRGDVKLASKLTEYRSYHVQFRKEMLHLARGLSEYSDLALFSDTHVEWRIFNEVTTEFLLGSPRRPPPSLPSSDADTEEPPSTEGAS